jgi:hypothetical protein
MGSMDIRFERAQAPALDPSAVESEPELVARLVAEIERDGPLTFARFMEATAILSAATTSGDGAPDPRGRFSRARAHPVFGRPVGRQLAETWER